MSWAESYRAGLLSPHGAESADKGGVAGGMECLISRRSAFSLSSITDVTVFKFQIWKGSSSAVAEAPSAEAVLLEADVLLAKCSPKANQALWGRRLRAGANQTGILCFHY